MNLSEFSLLDMLRCSRGLRNNTQSATSVNEVAGSIVGYLYSEFGSPKTGEPQCALVRFYKTTLLKNLSAPLQEYARAKLPAGHDDPNIRVLTLLATYGMKREWCDPALSVQHRAIPLPSVEIVERAPMIAELIRALGLEIADVLSPPISLLRDLHGRTYNVFHVPEARGSPFIPAQDEFVIPFGIKSVVGFGGLLPSGEFFAVVIFSRVSVPAEPAGRFKNIALDVKAILHSVTLAAVS